MSVESGSDLVKKNQTTFEQKSDRELVVTRTFNAPAKLVFDAWTKPEIIVRWWAPRSFGMKLVTCEVDLRVGGKYRFVFDINGQRQEFFGVYKEVERPTRLGSTDDEQKAPDGEEAVTTTTFTEKHGKTTVVVNQRFASKEALDAMAAGMEQGTHETYEQLDELLKTLL